LAAREGSRNRSPGFSRRAQYGLFLGYVATVAGAVVAGVILLVSTFDPRTFTLLRTAAAELTTPVASAASFISSNIRMIPNTVGDYFALKQRNEGLRKQIENDLALTQRARALNYENQRLKQLLNLQERSSSVVVAARLVSSSASSTRRYAMLNAGSRQGVGDGQPVRGPIGLIGRIVETGPNTARVLLLTDPESIVPVRRARDGVPAIIAGRGDGTLEVRSVNATNVEFQPGELLVTSGIGGIFFPNVPVARIISRSRDLATARPLSPPDTLDLALVEAAYLPIPDNDAKPR